MFILDMFKFILKLIGKILLIPILLLVMVINIFIGIIGALGSIGVGLFFVLLFIYFVMKIMDRAWDQVFLLTLISVLAMGAVMAATLVKYIADTMLDKLLRLMSR